MARAIAERLRYVIPCQSKPSRTVVTVLALALRSANEDGPRFELARWQAVVSREALQEPQAVAIKAAKSSLLQARAAIPRSGRLRPF